MKAALGSVPPNQAWREGKRAKGTSTLTRAGPPFPAPVLPSPPRVHRRVPERRSPARSGQGKHRELGGGGLERPRESGPTADGKEGEVQGLEGPERKGRRQTWSGVGNARRPGLRGWGWGWRWEGGGVGGGRRRKCRARPARAGAADELAQTIIRALAGSWQPPQSLGEGGRAGQSSGRRRRDRRETGGAPVGRLRL